VREGLVAVVSVKLPQPQLKARPRGNSTATSRGRSSKLINERLGEYFDRPRPRESQSCGAARVSRLALRARFGRGGIIPLLGSADAVEISPRRPR